jgi:hypothetical protein
MSQELEESKDSSQNCFTFGGLKLPDINVEGGYINKKHKIITPSSSNNRSKLARVDDKPRLTRSTTGNLLLSQTNIEEGCTSEKEKGISISMEEEIIKEIGGSKDYCRMVAYIETNFLTSRFITPRDRNEINSALPMWKEMLTKGQDLSHLPATRSYMMNNIEMYFMITLYGWSSAIKNKEDNLMKEIGLDFNRNHNNTIINNNYYYTHNKLSYKGRRGRKQQ